MENFVHQIETKIFFGKGQISNIGPELAKYGKSVLLVYGGGSIKKSGIYDNLIQQFKELNIRVTILSGIRPNPTIESVRKGVELCREYEVDTILAAGGGSTIDCAKVIAASVDYNGDPWDIVMNPRKINSVLPIFTVLTLSATGSEMDPLAVISNDDLKIKKGLGHPNMRPKASVLDPEYTITVSKEQTAAGTADIISHTLENYFSKESMYMQLRMCESILKTCFKYGEIAYKDPENYEARANLMWASSWAINGLLSDGAKRSWSVHPMEHALTAYHQITHGVGLAILTPHWMRYALNENTVERFVDYAINVWDLDPNMDKFELAKKSILLTEMYFGNKLNIPTKLSDIGINNKEELKEIANSVANGKVVKGFVDLDAEAIYEIYIKSF